MLAKMKEKGMKLKIAVAPAVTAGLLAVAPMTSWAADAGASTFDVTEVLGTSFDSMSNTMLGTVSRAVPAAIAVVAAVMGIKFGIGFFKGLTKK